MPCVDICFGPAPCMNQSEIKSIVFSPCSVLCPEQFHILYKSPQRLVLIVQAMMPLFRSIKFNQHSTFVLYYTTSLPTGAPAEEEMEWVTNQSLDGSRGVRALVFAWLVLLCVAAATPV